MFKLISYFTTSILPFYRGNTHLGNITGNVIVRNITICITTCTTFAGYALISSGRSNIFVNFHIQCSDEFSRLAALNVLCQQQNYSTNKNTYSFQTITLHVIAIKCTGHQKPLER